MSELPRQVLARNFGFAVETIRPAFPDCEAKRLIDARKGV